MKRKITGIHSVMAIVAIIIIVAATMVYIVSNESKYKIINATDINDHVGKKVKTTITPEEEIEIPSLSGYQYRCKENNITVSSNDSFELDKTITVYGEVREHEERIILFVD